MNTKTDWETSLQELASHRCSLWNRDFLQTWDQPDDDIAAVLATSRILEAMFLHNVSSRVFDTGLAVSIFRDQSTRTRFSFASAANLLGLALQEFDEKKSQVAHGETDRETATMVSFLTETVGIRDDLFVHEGHEYMRRFAGALDEGHREGVLHHRPSVINLQSDRDHPTQTLADLRHLIETFGGAQALWGRKIAVTWATSPSYGKPLSVPQGLIALMTRFGMKVVLGYPEGYDLLPETLEVAAQNASRSGGEFRVVHSMPEAFEGADVVYPKSWAPLSVMERRTQLLREKRASELQDLERECLENNAKHRAWECTATMMKHTRDGAALYMHCLPADISDVSCAHGEVAKDVFDRYRLATYRQAGYKPFVIAAMILLTRFSEPAQTLRAAVRKAAQRRLG